MDLRIEFVMKSLRTDNFRALCAEYGISAKTGYKWQQRFLREGVVGMAEQSRRPHGHADQLSEAVVCEIIRLKNAHRHWGPKKIRELYRRRHGTAASESSFKRVLEKAGLTEPRHRRQRSSQAGRLWSGQRGQAPNEVWTVDFKGWWYDGTGKRCEPLTVRDEHSRYILELRRMPDARTDTVRPCFERLFERHGLPGAIRSDNGSPFAHVQGIMGLSRLSAWWVALGIDLERGRPAHPQDNGGHERMHLDICRELEPSTSEQAALDLWREEFNTERPHESLGMKCPAEVYTSSARKYEGTPEDVDYPGMASRKVSTPGMLGWDGTKYFIGTSLIGWSVGLKPQINGTLEVWFGRLLLGWIEPATESFQRADIRPLEAGQP
ncbi:MAG TPA: IS481 family transposase [Verrucomicrobiae bacterium]|nr:IS481 family transposase [Verrucomicrobiae bacterium]